MIKDFNNFIECIDFICDVREFTFLLREGFFSHFFVAKIMDKNGNIICNFSLTDDEPEILDKLYDDIRDLLEDAASRRTNVGDSKMTIDEMIAQLNEQIKNLSYERNASLKAYKSAISIESEEAFYLDRLDDGIAHKIGYMRDAVDHLEREKIKATLTENGFNPEIWIFKGR